MTFKTLKRTTTQIGGLYDILYGGYYSPENKALEDAIDRRRSTIS